MYVCIIKMDDDKAVAALRAARRLPPPAWELIRAILGESPADPGVYIHSCCEADTWRWATPGEPDDAEAPDSLPLDPDDFTDPADQETEPLDAEHGKEDM